MPVAPRIVNDVSYEGSIMTFLWGGRRSIWQYLVRLQGDACRSARGRRNIWQYLVRLQGDACRSAHCK